MIHKILILYALSILVHIGLMKNQIRLHLTRMVRSLMKTKCSKSYFPNSEERRAVNTEFVKFSAALDEFVEYDSLNNRG